MSRVTQLNNYLRDDEPKVGQIVYKDQGNAKFSGKITWVGSAQPFYGKKTWPVEVTWPNGIKSETSWLLRDSQKDIDDRRRFLQAGIDGIERAKKL